MNEIIFLGKNAVYSNSGIISEKISFDPTTPVFSKELIDKCIIKETIFTRLLSWWRRLIKRNVIFIGCDPAIKGNDFMVEYDTKTKVYKVIK